MPIESSLAYTRALPRAVIAPMVIPEGLAERITPPPPISERVKKAVILIPEFFRLLWTVIWTQMKKWAGRDVSVRPPAEGKAKGFGFKSSLEEYARFSGYALTDAQKLIAKGKQTVELIQKDDAALRNLPPEHKRLKMAAVFWYLMSLNIAKGQGFEKGTILFEDPGHKIVRFFRDVGYRRVHSHFKKRVSRGYAIDVVQNHATALPRDLSTVLFGRVRMKDPARQFSFFKAEEFPSSFAHPIDSLRHLHHYQIGPPDRNDLSQRREKMAYLPAITEKFKGLLGKEFTAKEEKLGRVWGISGMRERLKQVGKGDEFDAWLKAHYPHFDHLDIRTGNETILLN